ncbi:unnamed protein product [Lepidochelys kempii]
MHWDRLSWDGRKAAVQSTLSYAEPAQDGGDSASPVALSWRRSRELGPTGGEAGVGDHYGGRGGGGHTEEQLHYAAIGQFCSPRTLPPKNEDPVTYVALRMQRGRPTSEGHQDSRAQWLMLGGREGAGWVRGPWWSLGAGWRRLVLLASPGKPLWPLAHLLSKAWSWHDPQPCGWALNTAQPPQERSGHLPCCPLELGGAGRV